MIALRIGRTIPIRRFSQGERKALNSLGLGRRYRLLADIGKLVSNLGSAEGVMRTTKLTDYVKTAEAAEILGVAQNTLRKWAARGDIPMHRNPANGYRLFKRSDLGKFLKKAAKPVTVPTMKKAR
jgi:excisionase family DNA binding protein